MNWKELLKVLKEFNIKGALVCESPDIVGDALMLKKYYDKS
jgi:deoxyribonuclease-4